MYGCFIGWFMTVFGQHIKKNYDDCFMCVCDDDDFS